VDNNYIYVGCANGYVYSINEATGSLANSYNTGGEVHGSPFIYMNNLFTTNYVGEIIKMNSTTFGNVVETDVDGSTNGHLSDLWIDLFGNYVWFTDGSGGNLYKVNFSDLSVAATYNFSGETLYAPMESENIVYFGAETSSGTGKIYAVKASDGTSIDSSLWPYLKNDPFRSPITIDLWNSVFMTGCDNNNVYMFSIPQ